MKSHRVQVIKNCKKSTKILLLGQQMAPHRPGADRELWAAHAGCGEVVQVCEEGTSCHHDLPERK